jgi:hypothetical protein
MPHPAPCQMPETTLHRIGAPRMGNMAGEVR